jgi:predicted O-methyltransferase YrrM
MYYLKHLLKRCLDLLLSPLTFLASVWFRFILNKGIRFFPLSDKIFMKIGVLPVRDHYYQPLINPYKHLKKSLRDNRALPGINMNTAGQLELLKQFNFNEELTALPVSPVEGEKKYYYDNKMCDRGDSEMLYSMIRHFKPARIIEVGSGNSTLMIAEAIKQNKLLYPNRQTSLICIEPYEQPWLESMGVKVIRQSVEDIDMAMFAQLQENDILFIDSSHIIRPQGDVLFEYLTLLPQLNKGVVIHVHDIFTPKDYPDDWIKRDHLFWNEQYLLEAFLSNNKDFEIIASLNYLYYNERESLFSKCPMLAAKSDFEPRSMWLKKVN